MHNIRLVLGSVALVTTVGAARSAEAQSASQTTASIAPATFSRGPADDHPTEPTAPTEDREQPPARDHAEERPFAFLLDPTTPSAGDASLEYALGYASGTAADRPLPSTLVPTGVQHALTFAYGITSRIAPLVSVRLLQPTNGEGAARATGNVGARLQLTDPDSRLRLSVATVFFREFQSDLGVYARVAGTYDIARFRLAANVHLEHVFAHDRDAVDVLALAGVSYRVIDTLRMGVEYVGQDLEGALDDEEAEGGAHHYVGPSVAIGLLRDRLQLTGGVAAGLGEQAQPLVGRVTALMTF